MKATVTGKMETNVYWELYSVPDSLWGMFVYVILVTILYRDAITRAVFWVYRGADKWADGFMVAQMQSEGSGSLSFKVLKPGL